MRIGHHIRPRVHTFVQRIEGREVVVPTPAWPTYVTATTGGGGVDVSTVAQMIEADNVRDDAAIEYHFVRENW